MIQTTDTIPRATTRKSGGRTSMIASTRKKMENTKPKIIKQKILQNGRQKIKNNQTRASRFYPNMTVERQYTFIDLVSKLTTIDARVLEQRIKFSGKVGEQHEIDLGMKNDVVKWACLLFFQFIDMIHDNGSRATTLSSWENFCTVVERSKFYKPEVVITAKLFVIDQMRTLFELSDSKECRSKYVNCVDNRYLPNTHTHLLFNILRIMILHSHFKTSAKSPIKLYSKPDERGTLLNIMRILSHGDLIQIRKQNVQTRVKASTAYNKEYNKHNALLSLDMTNGSRLKDFTALYYKYIHVVNFGDKGKYFLPERDIELIVKQIIRKDDNIINKTIFNNTKNIRVINNNQTNNNNTKNRYNANYIHYNDNPLRMTVGDLNVYVFNDQQKAIGKNLNNFKIVQQLLEPVLYYENENNQLQFQDEFRAAKSDDINKESPTETYGNLMSKHMGDFLNGVNSLHNNVIFASGDSLACVGYIVAFVLLNERQTNVQSRLMWEDSLNEQVFYISSPNMYDVQHFYKLRNKSTNIDVPLNNIPSPIPVTPPVRTMLSNDKFLKSRLENDFQEYMSRLARNNPIGSPYNQRLIRNINKNIPKYNNRRLDTVYPSDNKNNIQLGNSLFNVFKAPGYTQRI